MFLQPVPNSVGQKADDLVNEDFLRLLATQVYEGSFRPFATCLCIADDDYKSIVERKSHKVSEQIFEASAIISSFQKSIHVFFNYTIVNNFTNVHIL